MSELYPNLFTIELFATFPSATSVTKSTVATSVVVNAPI
jgi:hypothetical protein